MNVGLLTVKLGMVILLYFSVLVVLSVFSNSWYYFNLSIGFGVMGVILGISFGLALAMNVLFDSLYKRVRAVK